MDYTFDTTRPEINGKVVADVCFSVTRVCVNAPTTNIYSNESYSHGTIMATIASAINRDMNIVFIRIVPMTNAGTMGIYADTTMNEALNWVIKNKTKFSSTVSLESSMTPTKIICGVFKNSYK